MQTRTLSHFHVQRYSITNITHIVVKKQVEPGLNIPEIEVGLHQILADNVITILGTTTKLPMPFQVLGLQLHLKEIFFIGLGVRHVESFVVCNTWQNGTQCRDGIKVLWCRFHLVCLVFEDSIPTCTCLCSETFL